MVLGALPLSGLVASDLAARNGWGLFNMVELPLVFAVVLAFLARSLVSWCIHFAMHHVPLFWRVHRVHHTDTHLDVSTTVRFHPLEFVISAPIVFGVIVALGVPPIVVGHASWWRLRSLRRHFRIVSPRDAYRAFKKLRVPRRTGPQTPM